MGVNIPEILMANGTGLVIVVFLLLFRIRKQGIGRQQLSQIHEKIFTVMLVAIIFALVGETTSFLIDGRIFPGCYFLQYLSNTVCISMVCVVGLLWCLFVDYRIYCDKRRLKRKAAVLGVPFLALLVMFVADWFGSGFLFLIDANNCYIRGQLSIFTYVLLFVYFFESILNARIAQKRAIIPFFFPIYCFLIPCMIGTILQGLFYGLSTGWLATSVAMVFIYLELQTANYHVDILSGLFNRQYMNYYLAQSEQRASRFYGIMLDINDFKSINDVYGHTVGDRAISTMGQILSKTLFHNAVGIRMGGDEFVVFLSESSKDECQEQMQLIQNKIESFNKKGLEPFTLSVSMGSAYFNGQSVEEFLSEMDATMYDVKRRYHG